METQKYYTPTIDEFNIGFECEINNQNAWAKRKIENEDELHLTCVLHGNDGVRVKYLDKKDICQLGWKETSKDCYQFKAKEYSLFLGEKHTCIMRFDDILFTGVIKNKSELKKIMQMLRISK